MGATFADGAADTYLGAMYGDVEIEAEVEPPCRIEGEASWYAVPLGGLVVLLGMLVLKDSTVAGLEE